MRNTPTDDQWELDFHDGRYWFCLGKRELDEAETILLLRDMFASVNALIHTDDLQSAIDYAVKALARVEG